MVMVEFRVKGVRQGQGQVRVQGWWGAQSCEGPGLVKAQGWWKAQGLWRAQGWWQAQGWRRAQGWWARTIRVGGRHLIDPPDVQYAPGAQQHPIDAQVVRGDGHTP